MYMVRHHVSFYDLYSFVLAQRSDDLLQVLSVLFVNHLSTVLRTEHHVIFAHPFGMCQTICLVCHIQSHLSVAIGLNILIVTVW